jgi:hypothetical protein
MVIARQDLGQDFSSLAKRSLGQQLPFVHQYIEYVVMDFELSGPEILQQIEIGSALIVHCYDLPI